MAPCYPLAKGEFFIIMRSLICLVLFFTLFSTANSAFAARALTKTELQNELSEWLEEVNNWPPKEDELYEKDVWIQLILRLKTKAALSYENTNESLIQILSQIEEQEQEPEARALSPLLLFLKNLNICLRDDFEKSESIFEYIKDFTAIGGLFDPPSPEEFMRTRQYRGQGQYLEASPWELSAAAESLEVQELSKAQPTELSTKTTIFDPSE